MTRFNYIECQIERGAFTHERTFEIQLSPEITYQGEAEGKLVGTAHLDHLRDSNKKSLDEDEPSFGEPIPGFVQCRVIRDLGEGWVLAEVPSADVIHVSEASLVSSD
jgi:hypothetical protein